MMASKRNRRRLPAVLLRVGLAVVPAIGIVAAASIGLSACDAGVEGEWIRVSRGELSVGVDVEGALEAERSISVGPPNIPELWEYKIAKLAEDGQEVKKGDLLVAFDATPLRESLLAEENKRDSARATLDKRRSEISLLERDLELALEEARANVRKSELSANESPELAAHVTLQEAKLDYAGAVATASHLEAQLKRRKLHHRQELASLNADFELAERRYNRFVKAMGELEVKAEGPGTVIIESDHGGEKRKVGDRVWRAAGILEVASLDEMKAVGTVAEADYAKLRGGQSIRLRLEAHPDKEITGKLVSIGRSITYKSNEAPAKVVKVQIQVDEVEGLPLRPQMRFRGQVEIDVLRDVLVVSANAVFPSEEGPVVYRRRGDEVLRVKVKLGREGSRGIEVVSGLKAGDEVALTPLDGEGATP